jgi:hypothetical protein
MENTEENRKKLAAIIVSLLDPEKIKTFLALRYMEDLEDQEAFDAAVKLLIEKQILKFEEE